MGGMLSRAAKPKALPRQSPVESFTAHQDVQKAAEQAAAVQGPPSGSAPHRPSSDSLQALFDTETEKGGPQVTDLFKQIGGSIQGRKMDTVGIKAKPCPRMQLEGRLATADLRKLLRQHQQQEGPPNIEALARMYGVDKQLLQSLLRYNRLPVITTADDGRLLGH